MAVQPAGDVDWFSLEETQFGQKYKKGEEERVYNFYCLLVFFFFFNLFLVRK